MNPVNQAPGLQTGHIPVSHMFILSYLVKDPSKIFLSETMRPRINRLSMMRYSVFPNINPANNAPGVQIGHAPGSLAPTDL